MSAENGKSPPSVITSDGTPPDSVNTKEPLVVKLSNGDINHDLTKEGDGVSNESHSDSNQTIGTQEGDTSHDTSHDASHDTSHDASHDSRDPKSSSPVAPGIPLLTINESEDIDDGGVVKSKPPGHSRKGSSLSQVSVSCNSSGSISREGSFANADSVSLPLTLEQLKSDTSARTTSDPALMLTADLSRDDLSDEQRHETLTRLLEEVVALKLEIVNLREENEVLKRARSDMDDELHQLTENLFEEAYKMVDEAKGGKADAEKRLMDAAGQIEAMETKVSALNNLLHTNDTKSPITSPSAPQKHKRTSVKKMIKKMSRKSSSSSSKKFDHQKLSVVPSEPSIIKQGELMSQEFNDFTAWLEKGLPVTLNESGDDPYWQNVHMLQISPCLNFTNKQLAEEVQKSIENNTIILEPLAGTSVDQESFKLPCALTSESAFPCSYRMKLSETELVWHYISTSARNKIVSVCDFIVLVGYIRKGIVKKESVDLFWQLSSLRATMSLALLNLSLLDSASLS